MNRDDVVPFDQAAHLADRLSGTLSAPEEEIAEPDAPSAAAREESISWLYLHLNVARDRRVRMDAMNDWNVTYATLYAERERALIAARRHLNFLSCTNTPIDELLVSMANAEGIAL